MQSDLRQEKQMNGHKQRSIRFRSDLEQKLEQLAVEDGRSFSQQVQWLLRQALAQRSFAQQSQQREQQHAA
jgi:predicted transcriptional regulator